MTTESLYLLAADAMLVLHALFAAFVVLGIIVVYVGYWLSWAWVRNFWFRMIHLTGVAVVMLQSWLGVLCPLTVWEMQLRQIAGAETYQGSFIRYWLRSLLYFEAPEWVFTLCYTLFGLLVLASWFTVRPTGRG